MDDDGDLTVTTPTGITRVTRPPACSLSGIQMMSPCPSEAGRGKRTVRCRVAFDVPDLEGAS